MGNYSPKTFMGGAALVGASHRFGRPFVEATAGLGVEAYQSSVEQTTTDTSDAGVTTGTSESIPIVLLGFYLRGQATAGLSLSRSFELLASVGGHLGNVTRHDHFLTGGLAVRYRFPQ
jgi:hypothetical protein